MNNGKKLQGIFQTNYFKSLMLITFYINSGSLTNLYGDQPTPATVPIQLKAEMAHGKDVLVDFSWSNYASSKSLGYKVYYSNESGRNYHDVWLGQPTKKTKISIWFFKNGTYYFVVKPILKENPTVEGPGSNEVKVSITNAQPFLSNLAITRNSPLSYLITISHKGDLKITLRVLSTDKKEISLIFKGQLPKDKQTLTWDGKDKFGELIPPGDYFLEEQIELKKGTASIAKSFNIEKTYSPVPTPTPAPFYITEIGK